MSHNKITVSNQNPDSNGNISINVTDMSDVSISSPVDNQVLQYNSGTSQWQNQTFTLGSGLLILGQGDSNAYSNSGAVAMSGAMYLYAPSASTVNTLGATINKYSSTDWVTSITLPAGNYQAMIAYRVEFSTSGYFNFALANSSNNTIRYTNMAYIGENRTTVDNATSTALGYFELSNSTTVIIYSNASSGVDSIANQGNTPAEFSTLMIRSV